MGIALIPNSEVGLAPRRQGAMELTTAEKLGEPMLRHSRKREGFAVLSPNIVTSCEDSLVARRTRRRRRRIRCHCASHPSHPSRESVWLRLSVLAREEQSQIGFRIERTHAPGIVPIQFHGLSRTSRRRSTQSWASGARNARDILPATVKVSSTRPARGLNHCAVSGPLAALRLTTAVPPCGR